MKKFFTFIIVIMTLVIVNSSYAIDPGFYVGIGGSYAQQEFGINNNVSNLLNYHGASDEFGNTSGINLKIGCRVNDISSWELAFDYLPGFSWSDERSYPYSLYNEKLKADVDIRTFMLISKLSPNFGSDTIRPFMSAGIGLMHSVLKVEDSARYNRRYYYKRSFYESETSMCFKLGTGVDFFVKDNLSLGFEVAYVLGTGNLSILGQEIIDELKYMNYTFGVAYYF